jgi:hypothetical protein
MPSLPAMVRDSPLLVQQIKDLRIALRNVQNEKIQLQTKFAKNQLDNLQPLKVTSRFFIQSSMSIRKNISSCSMVADGYVNLVLGVCILLHV